MNEQIETLLLWLKEKEGLADKWAAEWKAEYPNCDQSSYRAGIAFAFYTMEKEIRNRSLESEQKLEVMKNKLNLAITRAESIANRSDTTDVNYMQFSQDCRSLKLFLEEIRNQEVSK